MKSREAILERMEDRDKDIKKFKEMANQSVKASDARHFRKQVSICNILQNELKWVLENIEVK